MKVILAFDSFKGAASAQQVCAAAALGVQRAVPDAAIDLCPLSDGGEGFAECMRIAGQGRVLPVQVTGPLFEPVPAEIVLLDDGETAVIEAAQACGLALVPAGKRSPLHTTSTGVGEMMLAAVAAGARRLIIGIGGSSTNDAGMGMLTAFGWRFLDAAGAELPPVGASLAAVRRIARGRSDPGVAMAAACDVRNPLYGPRGAAYTFAPQKGASPGEVLQLDRGLRSFARQCADLFDNDLSSHPGAGAAGGLGFALQLFFGAHFEPGAEIAIRLSRLAERLADADLCLTGEGRTDFQTAYGKLPAAVNDACRAVQVPCVCLSGALGREWRALYDAGFSALFSVCPGPMSVRRAIAGTQANVADAAESITRLLAARRH